MAGSQLKQLKASLRERGRLGPTPSKKQKKELQEARRQAKQTTVQEATPIKKAKFDFVNAPNKNGLSKDSAARERREQARRDGILLEMQRRQKVGGIVDRRFGEDDPTMTPDERAMERFVREKQRNGGRSAVFDLEDDEDIEGGLTHLGQPLSLKDDFQDQISEDETASEGDERGKKRRRLSELAAGVAERENEDPDRPKSKREIMEEVVAKSKLHKYERQKAKEDDDDLRAELDAGVADIFALMRGRKTAPKAMETTDIPMNPDRAALLNGDDRNKADRDYDMRLRAMVQDKRSQPTTRTKTEEETAREEALRLERLEQQRLRRMRGEVSEDDEEFTGIDGDEDFYGDAEDIVDSKALEKVQNNQPRVLLRQQDVEDEDDFELDENLVANESDLEALESDDESILDEDDSEDDDEEFIADLDTSIGMRVENMKISKKDFGLNGSNSNLAFTYKCPENLDDLLEITHGLPLDDLPTIVQRIRALYHPQLAEGNKDRLAQFAKVLIDFIANLVRKNQQCGFTVLEALIRHIHSLARSYPDHVSAAFRKQLDLIRMDRASNLDKGDLIILTAIGNIYPTSDHFHQVVTPAILTMTRYLEQAIPTTIEHLITGTYVSTLVLTYQKLSLRFVPEVINYIINAIAILAPEPVDRSMVQCLVHEGKNALRIQGHLKKAALVKPLSLWNMDLERPDDAYLDSLKFSILSGQLQLIDNILKLWSDKSALPETMAPFSTMLTHLLSKNSLEKLPVEFRDVLLIKKKAMETAMQQAISTRQPLALHKHRPLAIKMSIPKFEDSYNPDKRYDPDSERAESNKLRAEHKKERKAVIREFRKEARAEASVQLEEKKARDEAYEKKYKRLVAEIQGEEGREAKVYEREKAARKSKR